MGNDPTLLDPEMRLGFTVQTLTYPDAFELPRLRHREGIRLERAVALVIDDFNRIKRRPLRTGYVHEQWGESRWRTVATFTDLEELKESLIYRSYKEKLGEPFEPES